MELNQLYNKVIIYQITCKLINENHEEKIFSFVKFVLFIFLMEKQF